MKLRKAMKINYCNIDFPVANTVTGTDSRVEPAGKTVTDTTKKADKNGGTVTPVRRGLVRCVKLMILQS